MILPSTPTLFIALFIRFSDGAMLVTVFQEEVGLVMLIIIKEIQMSHS